jgi:hypothetical protein
MGAGAMSVEVGSRNNMPPQEQLSTGTVVASQLALGMPNRAIGQLERARATQRSSEQKYRAAPDKPWETIRQTTGSSSSNRRMRVDFSIS